MVDVKLFATFRIGREKEMAFEEGNQPVAYYVDALKIPQEEVSIILINGFHQTLSTVVKDGDTLLLFPATGGG